MCKRTKERKLTSHPSALGVKQALYLPRPPSCNFQTLICDESLRERRRRSDSAPLPAPTAEAVNSLPALPCRLTPGGPLPRRPVVPGRRGAKVKKNRDQTRRPAGGTFLSKKNILDFWKFSVCFIFETQKIYIHFFYKISEINFKISQIFLTNF